MGGHAGGQHWPGMSSAAQERSKRQTLWKSSVVVQGGKGWGGEGRGGEGSTTQCSPQ